MECHESLYKTWNLNEYGEFEKIKTIKMIVNNIGMLMGKVILFNIHLLSKHYLFLIIIKALKLKNDYRDTCCKNVSNFNIKYL